MPDNSARYHSVTLSRYHQWVQGLTLKQYILFAAVITFAVAAIVGAVTTAISGPFSWSWVAGFTVLMTAFLTWWRWDDHRQGEQYPASQDDAPTRS